MFNPSLAEQIRAASLPPHPREISNAVQDQLYKERMARMAVLITVNIDNLWRK